MALRPAAFALPICLIASLAPGAASADEPAEPVAITYPCDGLHRTQVIVDGFQRDWEDEAHPTERVDQLIAGEYRYDWTGPVDASFKMWCRYTENGLYFAVVGRDNIVVGPNDDGEDMFEVLLRMETVDGDRVIGVRVPVWDREGEGRADPVWAPGSGRDGAVTGARGEVAPREGGYFLEFNIPYIADRGIIEPFAPVPFYAAYRDIDRDADRERLAVVATAPADRDDPETWGALTFTGPDAQIRRLASERGVEPSDVAAQTIADVGAAPARELVLVLDGQLIVAGTGLGAFAWTSILVSPNDDYTPLGLEVHDIDGDGDGEIFYRFRRDRRSIDLDGRLRQEFLAVYDLRGADLIQLLLQETANELEDGSRFEMSLELRPRSNRTVLRFRRSRDATLARERWIDVDFDDTGGATPALVPWEGRDRIEWDRRADGTWTVLPYDG